MPATGSVLVICTGNICRSAVGEAILSERLDDLGLSVTSAGTQAADGRQAPAETNEFVSRVLGKDLHHVGRQLLKADAEAADLLVTMTMDQRARVARLAPKTVRRIFTLPELVHALDALGPDERFGSVKALALAASRHRPRAAQGDHELDINDPYGGPAEGYETAFQQVSSLSERVSDALHRHLATRKDGQI